MAGIGRKSRKDKDVSGWEDKSLGLINGGEPDALVRGEPAWLRVLWDVSVSRNNKCALVNHA